MKSVFELVNKAVGGMEYENRWLRFWECKHEGEIIKVSRECFKANGVKEEDVRKILPFILSWKTTKT